MDSFEFNHRPYLANHHDIAHYYPDGFLEWVDPEVGNKFRINHIIFDHDGTLSTLREGWEVVMLDMMLSEARVIAEEKDELREVFTALIDRTTGVQTITQMQYFVDWLSEHRRDMVSTIKTASDYKAIYLSQLQDTIRHRLEGVANGSSPRERFMIPGAMDALAFGAESGATLFLASGTDEADVIAEAKLMGYSEFFTGGIHGSHGDMIGDAKRRVLTQLSQRMEGQGIMVVGDGPVEMREGRRMGALCVGIASDEVTLSGVNQDKRRRLIQAGAHVILPNLTALSQVPDVLAQGVAFTGANS